MSFGKTTLRRWLPAAALVLALLCPLPVFAARAGAEIPVTVRTDGAACDTVYTVEITPLDNAPAPAQTSVQVKGGGTVYFTGLTFDAPGDYRYKLAQVKGRAADTTYDGRTYTVTVRVMTAADGSLDTELWAVRSGRTAKAAGVVFTNRYDHLRRAPRRCRAPQKTRPARWEPCPRPGMLSRWRHWPRCSARAWWALAQPGTNADSIIIRKAPAVCSCRGTCFAGKT